MNYVSIFDCNSHKRVAFLENAYDVGYKKEKNAVWSAQFSLPAVDPKNKYCRHFNWVEIYDGYEYIGLFRIMPSQLSKSIDSKGVVYECEHVLATLMDDVMVGWHEIGNLGVFTPEVLRYILDRQTVQRWKLGRVEFNHQYLYGWENENLLSALFSVPNSFTEDYLWSFDTTGYPWTLDLVAAPTKAKADIRYGKNMLGIEKVSDPTNLATRLYAFGYGEGDNQLNISEVNPTGKLYLDSDTQGEYGIITKIWIDQRYEIKEHLYQAAKVMLEKLKRPAITYTVNSAHIGGLLQCSVGDIVRVADDDEGIDIYAPIIAIEKDDIYGAPNECKITIGNESQNIASSVADLSDRQRVQEAYAQGAVTLFTSSFNDNCSDEEPAEMRFYIPANVVHINQVLLNGRATSFRGYTKATEGGGAISETSSDGGGFESTTESGGGGSVTSASGGGGSASASAETLATTSSAGGYTSTASGLSQIHGYTGYTSFGQWQTGRSAGHQHYYYGADTHNHEIWVNASHSHSMSQHSHTISLGSHSHSVSIGSHSHSVSIGSHSHSLSIKPHTHTFSIPNHTHKIEYGIYRGSTASSLRIAVDGNTVGTYQGSTGDINLISFLKKDDSGNVQRGWHNITITPDKLSRVEFNLITQLFANSRGGGQY